MPDVRSHGGGCCGMFHIYGFYTQGTIQDRQQALTTAIATCRRQMGGAGNLNRIMEVVLTDRQLEDAGWAPLLRAEGFRPVSRFRNSNSGNICTVFHHHPEPLSLDEVPNWDDELPIPAPHVAPAGGVAAPGNPFVAGQRVRCIQAYNSLLNYGNTYLVTAVDGTTVFLDGLVSWYAASRFEAIEAPADNPVVLEAAPEPAVVRTYYRNVYRTGVGPHEFETVEALLANRSGNNRIGIRRFDVMDNDTTVESVVEY